MPETLQGLTKPVDAARIRGGESAPLLEGSERSAFLEDYLRASKETDKKYPGHYAAEKQYAEEFVDHPERFQPSMHAIKSAYADFVVRPTGEFCWPHDVGTKFPVDANAMRNVEVKVDYDYSSTAGQNSAIVETYAEVPSQDGTGWERRRSGGIAFSLRDWAERIPDEELEQIKQGK